MEFLFWVLHQTVDSPGSPSVSSKFFCQKWKWCVRVFTRSLPTINFWVEIITVIKEYTFEKALLSLPALESRRTKNTKASHFFRIVCSFKLLFLRFYLFDFFHRYLMRTLHMSRIIHLKILIFPVKFCTEGPETRRSNKGSTLYRYSYFIYLQVWFFSSKMRMEIF